MKKIIQKSKYLEDIARKVYSLIPCKKRKLDRYFYDFLNALKENETKSLEEMKQYQFQKLKYIVDIAYNFTDFYRKKYDTEGFHPNDLQNLNDLKKIPMLTKDEIRVFGKNMVDKRVDLQKLEKGYTSGTTGKALELYFDKKTSSREFASICYQWERVGYKPACGRIELRGFIEDDRDFIYLADKKILRINIIKMSDTNINSIIKKIKQLNYKFIHGYPSAIFKFAKIIEAKKINFQPKAIMMASEVLYDWQMEVIDNAFNCSKIIHYGQAEKVALGAWTDERKYSFIPTYGILEFDENSKELIATGFINEVMPLIRYKLTDTVNNYSTEQLKINKTLFPVVENIEGREEDYTYNDKNNLVPPAIVTFPFKHLKFIDAAKIIQNQINDFTLLLETQKNAYNKELKNEIEKLILDFKKLYGKNAIFNIQITNKIILGANGKFRWIECKIK